MNNKKTNTFLFIKNNYGTIICSFFVVVSIIYIFIFKDDVCVPIWDNLDSNIVWLKMLKDNKLFWQTNTLVPFLGGINRDYLCSDLNVYNWLYMILSTFYALVIGWLIKIAMSIIGMMQLGKIILREKYNKNICSICGLLYGLTASFPTAAFAFASLPFLLSVLIKFYFKKDYRFFVFFIFYPLFSDLALFGPFICGYILLFFIIDSFISKQPKWRYIIVVLLLAIFYFVYDWRLIKVLLLSSSKTIRNSQTYNTSNLFLFSDLVKTQIDVFINGISHANCFHKYIIIPTIILYFIVKVIRKTPISLYDKTAFVVLLAIIFNSIIYGLDSFYLFRKMINIVLPFLSGFDFGRFVWLNPFLWNLLFMITLSQFDNITLSKIVCTLNILVLCLTYGEYNTIRSNIVCCYHRLFNDYSDITYKDFYSEELFDEIKNDINYIDEWSVAFGMHPAILEYNEIHTLDGYLSYYPEKYKGMFRKVIEPQLLVDEENREYYDNWGGRAYIYSNEVSYWAYEENYNAVEANLNININALKELGAKYIYSRVSIKNDKDLGIELKGIYSNKNSKYLIYLYSID